MKKLLVGLLLSSMITVNIPMYTSAETSGTVENREVMAEPSDGGEESLFVGGYLELPEDNNAPAIKEDNSELLKVEQIPAVYNPLENDYGYQLPAIRGQSPYGTCWAFSTAAITEMSYFLNTSNMLDVSELQIAYFTYHGSTDPLEGTQGDSVKYVGTNESYLNFGGNLICSTQALLNWRGATDEETVPYSEAANTVTNGLSSQYEYNSDKIHVQDVYRINLEENPDEVKKAIMTYGAVGASYYHSNTYYQSSTNSYYNNSSTSTNHAITIVGWNDNFPASDFKTQAPENGAWLIRNSWGQNNMSMYGYFWLSYADTSLNSTAYVVKAEDASNYDHNYQYDGSIFNNVTGGKDSVSVANVFSCKGEYELLKAVSINLFNEQVDYTIKIYKNPTDATDPESGTLISEAITSGSTKFAGTYTIPLQKEVLLKKGETFSVVVELNKPGDWLQIGVEYANGYEEIECTTSAAPGQSFLKMNSSWLDYGEVNNRNIRIKAFTSDTTAPVYTVSFNANGGTVTTESTVVTDGGVYGTLPTPNRAGYTFEGWYTEASGGTKVTKDTVASTGNHTLYAHWKVNEYTVTFNANGGTVSPATIKVVEGGKYGTLPTPNRAGYTFEGWYTEASGGTKVTKDTVVSTGNHTLYAHWKVNEYTVTFDANGGTVSPATIKVTEGGKYGTLPEAKRSGMTFTGWYTQASGGTRVTEDSQVTILKDHTLYAHYSGWTNGSDGELRLYDENGEMITNKFAFDGTYTYYLQADGSPMKDRLTYHPDGEHIIYLDENGHEVFNAFQYCPSVGYTCYFDSQGYIYKDVITFCNDKVYYLDGNGQMQNNGWFRFANGMDYGYANWDGSLNTGGFSYDPWGRIVFYHWNGMVARGLITDGAYYYNMDTTDGHYLGSFPVN